MSKGLQNEKCSQGVCAIHNRLRSSYSLFRCDCFSVEGSLMGRIVSNPPSAVEVKAARIASGLTQSKAAELIHCSARTWQNWELSCSLMHPAFWELFKLKVK